MNVFTYGSLMYAAVWRHVVRGHYRSLPAHLYGFQRFSVRGEHYLVIRPAAEASSVAGLLYLDVNPADLDRLDAFEGEFYIRSAVEVATSDAPVSAEA